jgi:ribonuclease-3
MLSSVIAAHLFQQSTARRLSHQNAFKIVREHLNELGRFKFNSIYRKQVPIQHFGENIHGNIFESLGAIYLIEVMYIVKIYSKRVISSM